jgi:hypothetical protein
MLLKRRMLLREGGRLLVCAAARTAEESLP